MKLIHGDCLIEMQNIPTGSIDLILCDLPFGTTKNKWDIVIPFDKLWEQYNRIIKDNGAIVLFGSEPFSSNLRLSNVKAYKYDWIWDKVLKTGHLNAKIMPMSRYENICIFGKGKINYFPLMEEGPPQHSRGKNLNIESDNYGVQRTDFNQKDGNTTKYPNNLSTVFQKVHPSKCLHPTQKPVALLEYLIKTYSKEQDLVLDNCMGSGSTGVACKNLNRDFIGIEMDKNYFDVAYNRINNNEVGKKQ